MASLNRVFIIGRLGRDPELRYTQAGQPVTTLNIATDESFTNQQGQRVERTEWHRVVVFGNQAEPCANHLAKGSLVSVEGALQTHKWQARDGSDRYTTQIKSRRVIFLQRASGAGQQSRQGSQEAQGARPQQEPAAQAQQSQHDDWNASPQEDLGPAFPSQASGMDDVPF